MCQLLFQFVKNREQSEERSQDLVLYGYSSSLKKKQLIITALN